MPVASILVFLTIVSRLSRRLEGRERMYADMAATGAERRKEGMW